MALAITTQNRHGDLPVSPWETLGTFYSLSPEWDRQGLGCSDTDTGGRGGVSAQKTPPWTSPGDEVGREQQGEGGDGPGQAPRAPRGARGARTLPSQPASTLDSKARPTMMGTTTVPTSTYKHVPSRDGTYQPTLPSQPCRRWVRSGPASLGWKGSVPRGPLPLGMPSSAGLEESQRWQA